MEDDFSSILQKSIKKLSNSPVLLLAGILVGIISLPGLVIYGHFDTCGTKHGLGLYSRGASPGHHALYHGRCAWVCAGVRQKNTSSLKTFIDSGTKYYVKLFLGGIVAFLVYYFLIFTLCIGVRNIPGRPSHRRVAAGRGRRALIPRTDGHRVLRYCHRGRRCERAGGVLQEHRVRQAQPGTGRNILHHHRPGQVYPCADPPDGRAPQGNT